MQRLLVLFEIVSLTFASGFSPLLPRQSIVEVPCSSQPGKVDCGTGCIDSSWTCCPDGSGGCPPTDNCELASNAKYACCPKGEFCVGNGGVYTSHNFGIMTEFQTEIPTATGTINQPSVPPATSTIDQSPTPCSQQSGMKACGGSFNCIPESYTCCPDGSGGCPSEEYCMLDNYEKYACCPNGRICSGSAGISSGLGVNPATTSSATSTSTSASSSSLATGPAAGGGATGPLAVNEVTIFGSFLIGLFPGLLG